MTHEILLPCVNPSCEHLTFVRLYSATRSEPGYESTDYCEECGDDLDWDADPEPVDDYDPAL